MSSLHSRVGSVDMVDAQERVHSREESTNAENPYQSNLSYRQNRRVQQLLRANGKKRRGPTRAIKWKNERNHRLGQKPTLKITQDMKRVIGENADQFITEVGLWVRNMLPLKSRGWKHIESGIKDRLFTKIKAEWNFPDEENVDQIIEGQCMVFYRQWRYRLKEKFFDGFSITGALKNCPEDVDPDQWKWVVEKYWGSNKCKLISEACRSNRSKQKLKASQGNISTARILENLRIARHATSTSRSSEQVDESMPEGFEADAETNGGVSEMSSSRPLEPEYIKLWERTKRHKDKSMDEFALKKLEEFKELHQEQLELHGVDKLTVQEAYIRILGTCSGYINGLGFGPKPPKNLKDGNSAVENVHLAHQIAEVEKASREREAILEDRIEKLQEREDRMLGEIEKLRKEAQEREDKIQEREERLKAEFCAMMHEKLSSIIKVQSKIK